MLPGGTRLVPGGARWYQTPDGSSLQVENLFFLSVCHHFEILNMCPLYHPRITLDPIYHIFSVREDVKYHLVMTMTHTNTKTKARTKTNTKVKCFKGLLYVNFWKSRGFKDFKFYLGYHLVIKMAFERTTGRSVNM